MKRNLIQIAASIVLGLLSYYLYVSFVGVMFTLTVKVFYLTRDLDQNLRKSLYLPFIVGSDIVTAIPVFLAGTQRGQVFILDRVFAAFSYNVKNEDLPLKLF